MHSNLNILFLQLKSFKVRKRIFIHRQWILTLFKDLFSCNFTYLTGRPTLVKLFGQKIVVCNKITIHPFSDLLVSIGAADYWTIFVQYLNRIHSKVEVDGLFVLITNIIFRIIAEIKNFAMVLLWLVNDFWLYLDDARQADNFLAKRIMPLR